MKIHTDISDINQEQWTELVHNSPNASFFQTRECYDFFASLSFLQPFVYGVSENNNLVGIICGYIIADGSFVKHYLSRRAIVAGGVLLDSKIKDEAIILLLSTVKRDLRKRAIYLEIRNYNDYSSYKSAFERVGFKYIPHLNFHVATPDLDTALKQLSTTKRRDIKLSRNSGAEWYETIDLKDVRDYYEILSRLYKTKVRTPLFPIEFLEKLILQPNAKLFVIKLEGELIGGSVCVLLPDRTIYEWFVCGLDGKFKNVFPSTIATWAAIEYAATNGLSRFDMMGAGKPDDGYGVRDFKSKFGGELVQHGRFLDIHQPFLYELGKRVIHIYRSTKPIIQEKQKVEEKNNYKILIPVEQSDFQRWSMFVKSHPNGNIFQTPEMFQIYLNTSKFRPFAILVVNQYENIVGCLLSVIQQQYKGILGVFSARSIINGGPLVEDNNLKIMEFALKEYNNIIKNKAIFSQFRNGYNLLDLNECFQINGYIFSSHLNYIIDLSKGQDLVWKDIHEGRKNKIKKALKSGLTVDVLDDNITINHIDEGYNIIKKVYDKADLPLADKELLVNAVKSNQIVLFLVKYEGIIIGCRFAFKYDKNLYGWYAGSYTQYYSFFPNDLLIWETLKWGIENGFTSFDYGGAGSPNKHYGVRNFKSQTGGTLVNYGRYEKIHKPGLNFFARIGFKIWQLFNGKNK